jgi:hypothetical protein
MEEVLAFLCSFFFYMIASLHFEELDSIASCDKILLMHDLDRVLGIC